MPDWFAQAFGAAVADIRAKLIDEGFFGRRVAEPGRGETLGWSLDDHPSHREAASDRSLLDRLYERDPGQFVNHDGADRSKERGIDR